MSAIFLEELSAVLNRDLASADLEWSFTENGGHSLAAIALSAALRRRGITISSQTILISRKLSDITRGLDPNPPAPQPLIETETSSSHASPLSSPVALSDDSTDQSSQSISVSGELKSAEPASTHQTGKVSWLARTFPNTVDDKASNNHVHFLSDQVPPSQPPAATEARPSQPGYFDVVPQATETTTGTTVAAQNDEQAATETIAHAPGPRHETARSSTTGAESRRDSVTTDTQMNPSIITEMQLSMIHGSLKYPGTNIVHYLETYATEYLPLMRMAWEKVIGMEPIFRTRFPEQLVGTHQPRFVWDRATAESKEDYNYLVDEACQSTIIGSHFRVVTWQPPGERSRSTIVWSVHHALIDGYSAVQVFQKVRQVVTGVEPVAGPSFEDLAAELKEFQDTNKDHGDAFWKEEKDVFADAKGDLNLPLPMDCADGCRCEHDEVALPLHNDYDRACKIVQTYGATPAALLHAAWALALSIYSDSDAVVFGSVVSGRSLPLTNMEEAIGPMVNTLPFCIRLDKEQSAQSFVRSVFEKIVKLSEFGWTTLDNGYSRQFESALAMQFGPLDENIECPVKPLERPRSKQITDIPLCIAIDDDGLLRLQYDSSRFNRRDAMRMGEILKRAILGLLRPDSTMSDVVTSLLSVPMLEQLREYGNCNSALTTRPSIKHDLVTLFEKAAGLVPDSIAIEKGDMVLTYKDLDVAASRVAAGLSSYVDPGEVVCLHADRSIGWIVGIYATLKLGAVYSPMAVDLPKQFRGTQFEAAAAKIFLIPDSSQREHRPSSCEEVNVLSIDDLLRAEATYLTEPRASPRPTDAAYLCFTSGSTGVPKGVLCAHESLVAFQRDLEVRLFAQPGTRVSQIMSAAFDGSIHEIFSALSYGATLVLPDGLEPFDHLSKVHSAILTPSIARVVDPTKYPDLRSVYLVGESVPPTVSNLWARQPGLALYNMFGPTEATCGATIKRLLPDETVTIGPPNPSTRIYIMDREQNLVPPGVIGELYLAGVQVARGYVGQAAQTRERFLADPICRIGEMMYKTGDRGYWTLTGDVMCLGRTDREVKLRGFRLNLNDLEIRITKTDPLIQAVAIAVKDDQLVALLQPETINVAQTKSKIEDALPKHAVPAQILTISRLPMTGAGKIDYKAIPRLFSEQQARPAQGLTTATQRRVANAFRFVLKIEKTCAVSGTSNFTELGGTSLMQVSLSSRLTREFGFQIPLRLVIERDNVLALAEAIDIMRGSKRPELHRCRTLGDQQVSPIEAEWLEKYDLDAGSSSFNVLYVCDFSPEQFDRERLTHTFNTVLKRHPMLRSRYVARRGKKVTRSYASVAPRVQQVQGISVWVEANRPFELHTSDPVRVLISEDKIMLVMSHIIADFTTLSILLSEAAALYKGQKPALPAKSYGECTVWYEDARPCYLEWWRETFSNVPQGPAMLKPGQERRAYRGSSAVFEVAKGLHASMRAYCTSTTVSLQQLAMGAVAASLSCDKQATDIVLGSPYVNRPTEEDRSVIGLFLEPLPVRVKYELECQPTSADGGPATFLQSVRQASQASLAQAIPWHQLLDHLEVEPNFPSHPLFDAVVSYHEVTQMSTLGSLIPGTQPLFVWSEGSKFKLMIEFSEFAEEKLMLRLEHDTDILTELEIGKLHKLLIRALELLVTETSFEDMMEALRAVMDGHDHGDHNDERLDSSTVFGRRIADL